MPILLGDHEPPAGAETTAREATAERLPPRALPTATLQQHSANDSYRAEEVPNLHRPVAGRPPLAANLVEPATQRQSGSRTSPTAVRQTNVEGGAGPSSSPALTRESLHLWATQSGQGGAERHQRAQVEQKILDSLATLRPFNLSFFSSLASLTQGYSVKGDLNLTNYPALTSLPPGLSVAGNLDMRSCTGLTSLPLGFRVGGSAELSHNTSLRSLPPGFRVGGYLHLMGCIGLTTLPPGVRFDHDLVLTGCTGLTNLPPDINVGGSLLLGHCTGLTSLPQVLSVGEDLKLYDCTSLTSMPQELSVGRDLDISDCTGLTALPRAMSVGGSFRLNGCLGITSLPEDLPSWGANGRYLRHIDLRGSGISEAVGERLRALNLAGMRVEFDMGAPTVARSELNLRNLAQAQDFWRAATPRDAAPSLTNLQTSQWQLAPEAERDLLSFLQRLQGTADYQNAQSRPFLATRVMTLLATMDQDAALRGVCSERIGEALQSCDDRVILVMNQLELVIRVHKAEHTGEDEAALRGLGLGLMKLEIVHRHAHQKSQSLVFVDEIEVFLAYETRLRVALDLPVSTQNMLFERCAYVTDADLQRASTEATKAVQNPALVANYLSAWAPWQSHERRQAVAAFSWEGLPVKKLSFAADNKPICPLTQEPLSKLTAPILYQRNSQWQVCDTDGFLHWWAANGTDPVLRQRMSLADLYRRTS